MTEDKNIEGIILKEPLDPSNFATKVESNSSEYQLSFTPSDSYVTFQAGQSLGKEVLKLTKDGFIYKNQIIEDLGEAYRLYMLAMCHSYNLKTRWLDRPLVEGFYLVRMTNVTNGFPVKTIAVVELLEDKRIKPLSGEIRASEKIEWLNLNLENLL